MLVYYCDPLYIPGLGRINGSKGKAMEKIIKFMTNRLVIAALLVFLQLLVLVTGIYLMTDKYVYIHGIFIVISIAVVFYIINKKENPSYKLAWIIPILIFPIFGGLFYLVFGSHRVGKHIKAQNIKASKETADLLKQDPDVLKEIRAMDPGVYNQVHYLGTAHRGTGPDDHVPASIFPIYKNTETEYLSPGEKFFERLLEELEKAQQFIFMEYFIIENGYMWDNILEILQRKVREGVEVRIIYDDIGCAMKLPPKYNHTLIRKFGINCRVFNPFRAHVWSVPILNNRDHRKITVIDGNVGFTGGINLSDEYMNVTQPFGQWKDSGVMLRGEAVWSLTVMFMQMWNLCGEYENFPYSRYAPYIYSTKPFGNDGYVMPYGDSPLDNEIQAEMVYLNMINKAKHYIYISPPYLIIDNELTTSLTLAAKSGVDVRIVTPHQYDKYYVHICTQANFPELIQAGVKIYEYKSGFIHSKTFLCDDEIATVGTVNLDYRSLYLHFECGTFMYRSSAVGQLKADYMDMLKDCVPVTLEQCSNVSIFVKLLRGFLKVFVPLL